MSNANWKFSALLFAGIVIVFWDFAGLFSGWIVASQREVGSITLFFLFCGVLPIVGFVGCCLRRKWGAWILLVSPLVATLGLLGIHANNGERLLIIVLFVVPTSALGFLFQRLFGGNAAHRIA